MVTSQDEEVLWIFDFVCEEKTDCLEGLLASVYIIAQEEIISFRGEAAIFEESKQIVVLSMDIACQNLAPLQEIAGSENTTDLDGSL